MSSTLRLALLVAGLFALEPTYGLIEQSGFHCMSKASMKLSRKLHQVTPQLEEPPFSFEVLDSQNRPMQYYTPGKTYTIRLLGFVHFRGYMIQPRLADQNRNVIGSLTGGMFMQEEIWKYYGIRFQNCARFHSQNDSLTHSNGGKKFLIKAKWRVERNEGPIQFMLTILQDDDFFWERWSPKTAFLLPSANRGLERTYVREMQYLCTALTSTVVAAAHEASIKALHELLMISIRRYIRTNSDILSQLIQVTPAKNDSDFNSSLTNQVAAVNFNLTGGNGTNVTSLTEQIVRAALPEEVLIETGVNSNLLLFDPFTNEELSLIANGNEALDIARASVAKLAEIARNLPGMSAKFKKDGIMGEQLQDELLTVVKVLEREEKLAPIQTAPFVLLNSRRSARITEVTSEPPSPGLVVNVAAKAKLEEEKGGRTQMQVAPRDGPRAVDSSPLAAVIVNVGAKTTLEEGNDPKSRQRLQMVVPRLGTKSKASNEPGAVQTKTQSPVLVVNVNAKIPNVDTDIPSGNGKARLQMSTPATQTAGFLSSLVVNAQAQVLHVRELVEEQGETTVDNNRNRVVTAEIQRRPTEPTPPQQQPRKLPKPPTPGRRPTTTTTRRPRTRPTPPTTTSTAELLTPQPKPTQLVRVHIEPATDSPTTIRRRRPTTTTYRPPRRTQSTTRGPLETRPPTTPVDLEPCHPSPCNNSGVCEVLDFGDVNKRGQRLLDYICHCDPEWTGKDCSVVNFCLENKCVNGVCRNRDDDFECVCKPGHAGRLCDKVCPEDFCSNGGKCSIQGDGEKYCVCKPGYTGEFCKEEVNECNPDPCENGAKCTDLFNDFSCACRNGYMGKRCERPCRDIYNGCKVWKEQNQCAAMRKKSKFFDENCAETCNQCVRVDSTIVGRVPLPPVLSNYSWLIGEWQVNLKSHVHFPYDFDRSVKSYTETLTFRPAAAPMFGTPSVNFTSTAVNDADPTDMHIRKGFLTIRPRPFDRQYSALVSTGNDGLLLVEEGDLVKSGSTRQLLLSPKSIISYVGNQHVPVRLSRTFSKDGPYLRETIDKEQTSGRKYSYATKFYKKITNYDYL